jgi:hypothetical protein
MDVTWLDGAGHRVTNAERGGEATTVTWTQDKAAGRITYTSVDRGQMNQKQDVTVTKALSKGTHETGQRREDHEPPMPASVMKVSRLWRSGAHFIH